MADNSSSSTISSSNPLLYRLTLGDIIGTSSPGTLKLVQGKSVLMDNSDDNASYYLTLRNIKVNRKIYQPTEIEAELDFTWQTTNSSSGEETKAPTFKAAASLFMRREVKLEVMEITGTMEYDESSGEYKSTSDDEAYTVAKNCFVYEVNPKLKRDIHGKKMYVKLNIFSMDKLMTLNKYSKCYVARKLGSEILKPESLNFGYQSDGKTPLIETNKSLRFLEYEKSDSTTDTNGNSTKTSVGTEFIQPYLVQYNESFYDFMVRTANRCGEFLYFEDGQLTLGLEETDEDDIVTIDEYDSVTERGISPDPLTVTPYLFDSVKSDEGEMDDLNYENIDKNDDGYPDDVFPDNTSSNAELSHDEFIYPLVKDEFDTFKRECNYDGTTTNGVLWRLIPLLKTLFAADDGIVALVSWAIGTEAITVLKAFFGKRNLNSYGNENWIEPYEDTKQYDSSEEKAVMFAPVNSEGWTTVDYYNDIQKYEDQQQRKIVCIDMGTKYINVQLGQEIKIDGLDDNYVIIQIEQTSEGTWENDYETYDSDSSDSDSSDKTEDRRSLKIFAIPSYEDDKGNEQFIPPVQPVPIIRKVGPQAAYVTDNMDPKYQGRVRVAYPWQSLGSAVKKQLQEATQKLTQAKAKEEDLKEAKKKLVSVLQELSSELEDLKKFVEGDDETRQSMIESKISELDSLKEEIDNLKSQKDTLEENLKTVKTEISKLESQEELSESDQTTLEEKQAYQAQLEHEIYALDQEIEYKEGKDNKLKEAKEKSESAATEDDEKKDDESYQDIEIDNTVIAKLAQAYKQAMDDYMAICDELEEAEEETTKAQEEKETIQEYKDKSVEAMSSPWIRIASPMATDGGGVYFKPNVGDEVLINYDNDNIERPYVVGSLYSKNVLDPTERLQRKAMPALQMKNISMSMISRNGHHITFTDPDTGGSFVTNFLSPGIGFLSSLVGLDEFGENIRDLAGGIHMGDRYNINEIELCTHKREVNIRSSLGTITLNAFKGIKIDAPNADISIRGMNINLEAGNKVNIISGANIKAPEIDKPDGKGAKVGNFLLGTALGGGLSVASQMFLEDTIDFSTIRRMIEIFVRPVDGTMLIKSKRYLMIEAGPGRAMVKADRYKKAKKDQGKVSAFLQGKSEGSDTKPALQEFYKTLIEGVNFISNRVDKFYQEYDKLYKDIYQAKKRYDRELKRMMRDNAEDAPDLIQKAYLNYDQKNLDVDSVINKELYWPKVCDPKKLVFDKNAKASTIVKYAKAYFTKVMSAYQFYDDAPKMLDNFESDKDLNKDFEWVIDCMKDITDQNDFKWHTKWIQFYDPDKSEDDKEDLWAYEEPFKDDDPFCMQQKTIWKRVMVLTFLYYVSRDSNNENDKYIKIGYDLSYLTKRTKLRQEHYWKEIITNMDHRWAGSKFWGVVFGNVINKFMNKLHSNFQSLDQNIWEDGKDGQILFSDKEDTTLNFEGNGLHDEHDANIGSMEHLRKILWVMK